MEHFTRNSGFSLVEGMIAVTILGAAGVFMSKAMLSTMKVQRHIQTTAENENIQNTLAQVLSNPNACAVSVSQLDPASGAAQPFVLKLMTGQTILQEGTRYGDVQLASLTATFLDLVGDKRMVSVKGKIEKVRDQDKGIRNEWEVERKINVTLDAGAVNGCDIPVSNENVTNVTVGGRWDLVGAESFIVPVDNDPAVRNVTLTPNANPLITPPWTKVHHDTATMNNCSCPQFPGYKKKCYGVQGPGRQFIARGNRISMAAQSSLELLSWNHDNINFCIMQTLDVYRVKDNSLIGSYLVGSACASKDSNTQFSITSLPIILQTEIGGTYEIRNRTTSHACKTQVTDDFAVGAWESTVNVQYYRQN